MKVEVPGAGVPGIANIGDNLSAPHLFSFDDPISIPGQMCIVKNVAARWIDLIKGYPASLALKESGHGAVGGGKNRQTLRRHYVDRIVPSTFTARLVKSVAQLISFDAIHRYQKIHSHKVVDISLGNAAGWFYR